jgi:hypothetical protein
VLELTEKVKERLKGYGVCVEVYLGTVEVDKVRIIGTGSFPDLGPWLADRGCALEYIKVDSEDEALHVLITLTSNTAFTKLLAQRMAKKGYDSTTVWLGEVDFLTTVIGRHVSASERLNWPSE